MSSPYDVLVLGAGLTGLTIAERLLAGGLRVAVLERSARPGGVIQSGSADGYRWERGPNSILVKSPAVESYLMDTLALASERLDASTSAKKRYIVRDGRLVAVPASPLQAVCTPLFSFGAKCRFLGEPFHPRYTGENDESVADFVRRRLGPEFLDYAIGPFVSGVYAGDPAQLAVRHAFPKVHALETRSGSLIRGSMALAKERKRRGESRYKSPMLTFREGLETLPRTLAQRIGEHLFLETEATCIEREASAMWRVQIAGPDGHRRSIEARHLVLATPTHAWARLPFSESLRAKLESIPQPVHPPVATLALGFRREQISHPLDGFGALIPQRENEPFLGVIFSSSLFEKRALEGYALLTLFLGGVTHPLMGSVTTDEALAAVQPSLKRLLGVEGNPVFVRHQNWSQAIPQYGLQHSDFLRAMDELERGFPSLHLRGNFRGGPGLSDVIGSGLHFTETLRAQI